MKHWDGRDLPEAIELRPARLETRVRDLFRDPPKPKRREPQIASVIGLVLAVTLLVALSWALAPSSPVSSKLVN